MRFTVKVITNAKHECVEKTEECAYTVRVHNTAEKGKANKRVQKLLANYLGVSPSSVTLVQGARNRIKVFEI